MAKVLYNDGSFLLHNNSGQDLLTASLAFERLDAQGSPTIRFDGARWTEFSDTTLPNWCVSITVLRDPPYLEPPECGNRYNSTLTPTRSAEFIFWRSDDEGEQFRALWNGSEIARCEIAAGQCAVKYP